MIPPIKSKILYKILAFSVLVFYLGGCQDDPIQDPGNGGGAITPKSKAFINLVQLNDFPDNDPSGVPWDDTITIGTFEPDSFGRADISMNISVPDDPTTVLWSQNSHFTNSAPSDTLPYILLNPYEVIPFGSTIDVNIYDYELPDNTYLGKVSFLIDTYPDPDNPYPSYVTAFENGFSVTIGITWQD
jgi:hypothetical protein